MDVICVCLVLYVQGVCCMFRGCVVCSGGVLYVQGVPTDSWRISRINENYELSDTYPSIVSAVLCLIMARFMQLFAYYKMPLKQEIMLS